MNLWMMYTCNMKKEEGERILHYWPGSLETCGCRGLFEEFKDIQSMVNPRLMEYNIEDAGILIQEEGRANYWKKAKLKTEKLSKNTILDE